MEEKELVEIGKEAYVLSEQIEGLEQVMKKREEAISGYPSHAKNFNSILDKAKKILEADPTILKTISHLNSHDPNKEYRYTDFEGLKSDLATLKGALKSFFAFHFPKKEKEKIGFI